MPADPFIERMLADAVAPHDGSQDAHDAEALRHALSGVARHEPSTNASAQVMHIIIADLDAVHARKKAIPAWIATALLVMLSAAASLLVGRGGGLSMTQGSHCLTEIVLSGAVPYMAISIGLRLLRAQHYGPWLGAIAAGSALCAQFVLHFRCPDSHGMWHLLAFHTGAVGIAAALGASSGVRLMRAATT